jgi:hypothetical protein
MLSPRRRLSLLLDQVPPPRCLEIGSLFSPALDAARHPLSTLSASRGGRAALLPCRPHGTAWVSGCPLAARAVARARTHSGMLQIGTKVRLCRTVPAGHGRARHAAGKGSIRTTNADGGGRRDRYVPAEVGGLRDADCHQMTNFCHPCNVCDRSAWYCQVTLRSTGRAVTMAGANGLLGGERVGAG